jgi:hypothetical protein
LRENFREFWERIEKYEVCDQRKRLGFVYSEIDGQDCSKKIVFNDWEEDLVLKIEFSKIWCMNMFSVES